MLVALERSILDIGSELLIEKSKVDIEGREVGIEELWWKVNRKDIGQESSYRGLKIGSGCLIEIIHNSFDAF